jgi:hypothetical protein
MNARGRRIALDEAAAGETLALDVCDAGGHTLLAAGTGLAAAAVAALRRRGVPHVQVVAERRVAKPRRVLLEVLEMQKLQCRRSPSAVIPRGGVLGLGARGFG